METSFSLFDHEDEVSEFLNVFYRYKSEYGIVFYEPEKNLQALLDMETCPREREKIIDRITSDDFFQGPSHPAAHSDITCWEFNKSYRSKEIHIVISLGLPEEPVRCYTFCMK